MPLIYRRVARVAPTRRYLYRIGAGFYVLLFPVGVPLGFLGLLYHFGVPRLAERRIAAAWLQVALQDAWQADVLSNRAAKQRAEQYGITEGLTVATAPLDLVRRAQRAQRRCVSLPTAAGRKSPLVLQSRDGADRTQCIAADLFVSRDAPPPQAHGLRRPHRCRRL